MKFLHYICDKIIIFKTCFQKAMCSQNHRMLWVNLKKHLFSTPCHGQRHFPPEQIAQGPPPPPLNLALNTSKDRKSTVSLGNPFQCFTVFPVKKLLLKCNVSTYPRRESLIIFLVGQFLVLEGHTNSPWSLLWAEQALLPRLVFIGELLQPSHHFCHLPLELL